MSFRFPITSVALAEVLCSSCLLRFWFTITSAALVITPWCFWLHLLALMPLLHISPITTKAYLLLSTFYRGLYTSWWSFHAISATSISTSCYSVDVSMLNGGHLTLLLNYLLYYFHYWWLILRCFGLSVVCVFYVLQLLILLFSHLLCCWSTVDRVVTCLVTALIWST